MSKTKKAAIVLLAVFIFALILAFGGYFLINSLSESLSAFLKINTQVAGISTNRTDSAPTPSPSLAFKSGTPQNGFMISDSDKRELQEGDLENLTPWQLKIARNEISARHGSPFISKDLQCYFATQNWYQVDYDFNEIQLSSIEKNNVELIKKFEEKIQSQIAEHDSGC